MIKKSNYITPKGHKFLIDELNQLLKIERPETIKVIQWAASLGDRSENADYLYAKKRLREIDKRTRFLQKRIDDAVIVDPIQIKSSLIKFGATVTVMDEDAQELIYYIVGQDEIDIKLGKISWKSPIGSALLNKEVGDTITIQTPKGLREFEVLELKYQEIP